MNKFASSLVVLMALCLLSTVDLEALGTRGGGGGSHGGGGYNANRSPSMSRSTRPKDRHRSMSRRTEPRTTLMDNTRNQQAARQVSQPTRTQVQSFLRESGTNTAATRPTRANTNVANNVRTQQQLANNVRDRVGQTRPNHGNWFNNDFWSRHHGTPAYWRHDHPGYWWRWGNAAAVAGWLGWDNAPIYYGYDSDDDYWGPMDVAQVDQAPASDQIVTSGTQVVSDSDWLPLGVFALSPNTDMFSTPNIFLQLAISKSGEISGAFYNAITDESYEMDGDVDHVTQRVALKVVDKPSAPILETGLYNLTQNQAPVRVHFADGRTQEMLLVRLQNQTSTQ